MFQCVSLCAVDYQLCLIRRLGPGCIQVGKLVCGNLTTCKFVWKLKIQTELEVLKWLSESDFISRPCIVKGSLCQWVSSHYLCQRPSSDSLLHFNTNSQEKNGNIPVSVHFFSWRQQLKISLNTTQVFLGETITWRNSRGVNSKQASVSPIPMHPPLLLLKRVSVESFLYFGFCHICTNDSPKTLLLCFVTFFFSHFHCYIFTSAVFRVFLQHFSTCWCFLKLLCIWPVRATVVTFKGNVPWKRSLVDVWTTTCSLFQ